MEKTRRDLENAKKELETTQKTYLADRHESWRREAKSSNGFWPRETTEEREKPKGPQEGKPQEEFEVDYNDSTDEEPEEGEYFFSPPPTPETEGEGKATETAREPDPGLQPSSSSATEWDC